MLITNATLITWESPNRVLENHALFLEGSRIRDIGPVAKLEKSYPKSKKLDARGQIVMPGGICAHTHFYSAFSRGMAIPGLAPKDFPEILEKLWWPLDKSLLEEDIRYSALISLVDVEGPPQVAHLQSLSALRIAATRPVHNRSSRTRRADASATPRAHTCWKWTPVG